MKIVKSRTCRKCKAYWKDDAHKCELSVYGYGNKDGGKYGDLLFDPVPIKPCPKTIKVVDYVKVKQELESK